VVGGTGEDRRQFDAQDIDAQMQQLPAHPSLAAAHPHDGPLERTREEGSELRPRAPPETVVVLGPGPGDPVVCIGVPGLPQRHRARLDGRQIGFGDDGDRAVTGPEWWRARRYAVYGP
jgi:hypothetical protein